MATLFPIEERPSPGAVLIHFRGASPVLHHDLYRGRRCRSVEVTRKPRADFDPGPPASGEHLPASYALAGKRLRTSRKLPKNSQSEGKTRHFRLPVRSLDTLREAPQTPRQSPKGNGGSSLPRPRSRRGVSSPSAPSSARHPGLSFPSSPCRPRSCDHPPRRGSLSACTSTT